MNIRASPLFVSIGSAKTRLGDDIAGIGGGSSNWA
jgi:hypothetical protein